MAGKWGYRKLAGSDHAPTVLPSRMRKSSVCLTPLLQARESFHRWRHLAIEAFKDTAPSRSRLGLELPLAV